MWTAQYQAAFELLERHYTILAVGVSMGAIQIAASYGGLRGMWLLPSAMASRLAGVAIALCAIAFFFLAPLWVDGPWEGGTVSPGDSSVRGWGEAELEELPGATNVNDLFGGLSGVDQARQFPIAAGIALIISLFAGMFWSLVRKRTHGSPTQAAAGLEGLETQPYPEVLRASLRQFSRSWRSEMTAEFVPGKYPRSFVNVVAKAVARRGVRSRAH